MANRFDTASQVGVGAKIQDQRRKDGRVLPDLNMAAPLDARTRVSKRKVAEIAREEQEIRKFGITSESPASIEASGAVYVFGEEVEDGLASKIAADPKLHRKLRAITSPAEAQAWARAERDEGEAPAVRRRQIRKANRGYKDSLDIDLEGTVMDLVAATSNQRAEVAKEQTGEFVRKHHGGVTKRRDHATIANPTLYKDEAERRQKERYLAAKAPAVDNIDLAVAQLNESFGADYAAREDDGSEVDVFTLCQEQSRDVIAAMGATADLEQELIEEGGFHIVKINPIRYRSLGDSAQDDL